MHCGLVVDRCSKYMNESLSGDWHPMLLVVRMPSARVWMEKNSPRTPAGGAPGSYSHSTSDKACREARGGEQSIHIYGIKCSCM